MKSFGLEAEDESVQFEKFSTYCVISSRFSATFDLDDVATGPGDEGIDGVAVVIDEAVTTSVEDTQAISASQRRNHEQVQPAAERIIETMGRHGQPATDVFDRIVGICQGSGDVSSDRLKRQAILAEMLAQV